MKSLTLRVPDALVASIAREATDIDFKIDRRHSRLVVPCAMP